MPLLTVLVGVVLLILLISRLKMNTFIALLIVSFGVALVLGIPAGKIVATIEAGIGGTLGHIALIFGLGAMLGHLVAGAGGAQRIAMTLIRQFGQKKIEWAVIIASFIVGIAMFFEVGLVLLIPIVYSIAREMKVSMLFLGISMLAALLATHAFLPPHPGPTVIAGEYGADIGLVLLYGIIVAIPTVLVAGPLYTRIAKKIVPDAFAKRGNISSLGTQKEFNLEETPSFAVSMITAMFPVFLMLIATAIKMVAGNSAIEKSAVLKTVVFLGDPSVAMLISVLVAVYTMGIRRNIPITEIAKSCSSAASDIGMMLLIIGGGGAFKQVLVVGGVGSYIATLFAGTSMSPIFLAWVVAAILRISLGSATVAAISTAGLVIPMLSQYHVNLALVTLATGCGSAIASHVNDAGFWMVKEYFGLTLKETFATWTVLSTITAVVGLVFILLLDMVLQ
ncbi:MAG: gluconate:H+ symporter [Sporomusaceae bacterium]|nr:gluconate:H+ symporter [Sporomusaceae bacterium]